MKMTKSKAQTKSFAVLALAGTMLVTGLAGSALANDRGDRDRERGGASSFQAGERFARADVDGDRMLSVEEFTAQSLERFVSADGNGDGLVTAEEMAAARMQTMEQRAAERTERREERRAERMQAGAERMQARAERMIERLDTDDDGAVSIAEATAASEAMFARMDRDDDGSLEPRELSRGFSGGDRGDRDGDRRHRGERSERGQDRPAQDGPVVDQSL